MTTFSYLGLWTKNEKTKDTFFSSTFKVQEKKVPRYSNYVIFIVVIFLKCFKKGSSKVHSKYLKSIWSLLDTIQRPLLLGNRDHLETKSDQNRYHDSHKPKIAGNMGGRGGESSIEINLYLRKKLHTAGVRGWKLCLSASLLQALTVTAIRTVNIALGYQP